MYSIDRNVKWCLPILFIITSYFSRHVTVVTARHIDLTDCGALDEFHMFNNQQTVAALLNTLYNRRRQMLEYEMS